MVVVGGASGLVLGTAIGTVTSAVIYMLQDCLRNSWHVAKETLFQYIAPRFGIAAHTFQDLSHSSTMPRLLKEVDLLTHRYTWYHEANAESNDNIQHGTIRLPAKSWLLRCLAFARVTHYVYISADARTIHMVAPNEVVDEFIRMSNIATTRPMSVQEQLRMRRSFGLEREYTEFDRRCNRVARRWVLVTGVGAFGLFAMYAAFSLLSAKACCVVLAALCCAAGIGGIYRCYFLGRRSIYDHRELSIPFAHPESEVMVEQPENTELRDATQTEDDIPNPVASVRLYSLVVPRENYYEIAQQLSFPLHRVGHLVGVDGITLYGIMEQANFMELVASCVDVPSDVLLYMCLYHPLQDPPLLEVRELLDRAAMKVFIVVVLPPILALTQDLREIRVPRLSAGKCTQYVASLCDFQAMLQKVTSGLIPRMAFVLPLPRESESLLEENIIWQSFVSTLGGDCCRILSMTS